MYVAGLQINDLLNPGTGVIEKQQECIISCCVAGAEFYAVKQCLNFLILKVVDALVRGLL